MAQGNAAGSLDGGLGTGRGGHALQHELLGQFALLHDLGALGGAGHQLGGTQRGEVDLAGFQLFQLVGQHFRAIQLQLGAETDLRQTLDQRHLAAFELRLDLALAGARERALVAATRGLAQAGTDTTADAGAFGTGAVGGLQCVETHVDYSSTLTR